MKLELKNINKTYGSTKVLENINFQLNKKECVGIIGPNGAGKSTLFKVVSGIINQDSGSIEFNDKNINSYSVEERSRICLLYTSPSPRDRTRSRMPSSA